MNNSQKQPQTLKNQENLYTKQHATFDEQLELLKERGLSFSDELYALNKLKHINYYRLSAYFLPFQYKKDSIDKNKFLPNTSFENIIELYYFDVELRKIIFEAIEVIEVYLRTQITYFHAQKYGSFGYLKLETLRDIKTSHDKDQTEFDSLHASIKKATKSSKEVFIKHFADKYKTTDLPIWAVVEIISFSSLSKLFMLLKEGEQKEVISCMDVSGSIYKGTFVKWFKALTSVRNACAHHSRLWNKTLGISFEIPHKNESFRKLEKSKNKIFFALTVVEHILSCTGEDDIKFKSKIKNLLDKYPNVDKKAMGFIENWQELEIWK